MRAFEDDFYDYSPTIIEQIIEEKRRKGLLPKSSYTKDEVIAMFEEIQNEIEKQCKIPNNNASAYDWNNGIYACYKVIQQKINALKGE